MSEGSTTNGSPTGRGMGRGFSIPSATGVCCIREKTTQSSGRGSSAGVCWSAGRGRAVRWWTRWGPDAAINPQNHSTVQSAATCLPRQWAHGRRARGSRGLSARDWFTGEDLEDRIVFTSGEELLDPSDRAGGPQTVAEAMRVRILSRFGLPVQIFFPRDCRW